MLVKFARHISAPFGLEPLESFLVDVFRLSWAALLVFLLYRRPSSPAILSAGRRFHSGHRRLDLLAAPHTSPRLRVHVIDVHVILGLVAVADHLTVILLVSSTLRLSTGGGLDWRINGCFRIMWHIVHRLLRHRRCRKGLKSRRGLNPPQSAVAFAIHLPLRMRVLCSLMLHVIGQVLLRPLVCCCQSLTTCFRLSKTSHHASPARM